MNVELQKECDILACRILEIKEMVKDLDDEN